MSVHIHVLPWCEIVRWEADRGICRLAVISLSDVLQIMRDNLMPSTPASLHISPMAYTMPIVQTTQRSVFPGTYITVSTIVSNSSCHYLGSSHCFTSSPFIHNFFTNNASHAHYASYTRCAIVISSGSTSSPTTQDHGRQSSTKASSQSSSERCSSRRTTTIDSFSART